MTEVTRLSLTTQGRTINKKVTLLFCALTNNRSFTRKIDAGFEETPGHLAKIGN